MPNAYCSPQTLKALFLSLGLTGVNTAVAEPIMGEDTPAVQTEEVPEYKKNMFMLRGASLSMGDTTPELRKFVSTGCLISCDVAAFDITEPLPFVFTSSSNDVLSLDFEHFTSRQVSYGFEMFRLQYDFDVPSLSPSQGKYAMNTFMLTAKRYFDITNEFRFYAGVGAGLMETKMTGSIEYVSRPIVSAFDLSLGVDYQFENISIRVGYQALSTNTMLQDAVANDSSSSEVTGDIGITADGYFAGVGILF